MLIEAEELRKKEREHEQTVQKMNKVVHKRKSALIESHLKDKKINK